MKERLQILIKELLMSVSEFARSIDMSQDLIYKILRGDVPVSDTVIKSIYTVYPNLSRDWFEKGIGEIYSFKKSDNESLTVKEDNINYGCKLCQEKERYIKSLEDRVEAQKKVIESQERCIETLRTLGGGTQKTASG